MTSGRSVLMIGGTRFFGRGILAELQRRGHAVTVLTRGNRPPPAGPAAVLTADRKDPRALAAALGGRGFDAVIDNVCYEPADAEAAARLFAGRCRRYVFTSSVMSYLNAYRSGRPLAEEDWEAARSVEGMEEQYGARELDYARNKRACEQVFLGAAELNPLVFRLHNVVGPDDFSGKSAVIPQAIARDGAVTLSGRATDTYQQVFAGDLGALYAEAVERQAGLAAAYNVAAPPLPQGDYAALAAAALGVPAAVGYAPPGTPGALAPFPRNVVLDGGRLARDFAAPPTPIPDFLPAMARGYAEAVRAAGGPAGAPGGRP